MPITNKGTFNFIIGISILIRQQKNTNYVSKKNSIFVGLKVVQELINLKCRANKYLVIANTIYLAYGI